MGDKDAEGLLDPDIDGVGEVVSWLEDEIEPDADEVSAALSELLALLDRELESAPVLEPVPLTELESALEVVGEADALALTVPVGEAAEVDEAVGLPVALGGCVADPEALLEGDSKPLAEADELDVGAADCEPL